MNTFSLVWQHNFIPAVRISVDIDSALSPAIAAHDSSALMEEADDFVAGASLDLRDFTLAAVIHGENVIAWFADGDTPPVRQPLTAEEIARDDEERDNQ